MFAQRNVLFGMLSTFIFGGGLFAQAPAKVDFSRDVLPIFRQNCVGCHGPSQQLNGLRMDRRSSAMKPGGRRIVPGNLENSLLYYRLSGDMIGPQMPPTGPLSPEQLSTIKTWIEQGADWPDAFANEADLPPPSPKAIAMVEALRVGDAQKFLKMVSDDPRALNDRGPEGSTPFMYAALYAPAATLDRLIKQGADVNRRNDAGATALMWAATDLEKTRVLVASGADVNAKSDDFRTPLLIAAGRTGGAPVVRLLLDRGANPNPFANPDAQSSPLIEAATAGDAAIMQLLIDRGADVTSGMMALVSAVYVNCTKCVDLLVGKNLDKMAYTIALLQTVALADVKTVRLMLDRGADVNAVDPTGRTALMYAASSDLLPVDVVKLLIERGANVNAKSLHPQSGDTGQTALDLAKLRGTTPVVEALVKAGATGVGRPAPALKTQRGNTIQAAVQRSLPLLQRSDASFILKAGCFSCHNNSIAAMAVSLARRHGFRVDEQVASQQVKANVAALENRRDQLHQNFFVPVGDTFGPGVLSYALVGLNAEGYKPDLNTDVVAMYLKARQMTDGHWEFGAADIRPPLGTAYIGQTALSIRALQLYAPNTDKAGYEKSIQLAGDWLAKAETRTNEDAIWRLVGLAWAGRKDAAQKAMRGVLGMQRPDGGWPDLPSMESTAYTTGRALVALETAGLPVSDPAFQRGVQYLLNTQQDDGSWYVKTRALGFQPYFDNGFPYAVDQWISAAGTSWATMALTLASQPAGKQ